MKETTTLFSFSDDRQAAAIFANLSLWGDLSSPGVDDLPTMDRSDRRFKRRVDEDSRGQGRQDRVEGSSSSPPGGMPGPSSASFHQPSSVSLQHYHDSVQMQGFNPALMDNMMLGQAQHNAFPTSSWPSIPQAAQDASTYSRGSGTTTRMPPPNQPPHSGYFPPPQHSSSSTVPIPQDVLQSLLVAAYSNPHHAQPSAPPSYHHQQSMPPPPQLSRQQSQQHQHQHQQSQQPNQMQRPQFRTPTTPLQQSPPSLGMASGPPRPPATTMSSGSGSSSSRGVVPGVGPERSVPERRRSTSGRPGEVEEVYAVVEDKRRRNTAASARFRVKKKHKVMELERSVSELEGRAGELEKEASELRQENGWLKEMLIMKGRRRMGGDGPPSSEGGMSEAGADEEDEGDDDEEEQERMEEPDKDKDKGKGVERSRGRK